MRQDLSEIVHLHPPIAPNGQMSTPVTFPAPGQYKVVIDVYQKGTPTSPGGPSIPINYQLTEHVQVQGAYHPKPLGPARGSVTTDGYTFTIHGNPDLRAAQAGYLNVTVTGPDGKPVEFHPVVRRAGPRHLLQQGSLAYFHTHICAPGEPLCAGLNGAVSGQSTNTATSRSAPCFPRAARWRLFLQGQIGDKIVTAPFTLNVRS